MALVPGSKKKLKDLKIKTGAIDDMYVNTNYGGIDEVAIVGTSLGNPSITYTPRYIDRKINFGSTNFNMKVGRLTTPPYSGASQSMNSYNGLAGTVYGYSDSFDDAVMGAGLHSTGVTSSIGFLGYGNYLTSYGFVNPYTYSSSNLYNMLTRPLGYQYNLFTVGTSVTASSIGSVVSGSPTQDNDFHSYTDANGATNTSSRDSFLTFSTNGVKTYTITQLVFFKNTGTGGTFPPAQPWNSSDLAGSDTTNHCILVLKTNNAYSTSSTYPHLETHGPVKLSIYPNDTATGTPLTLYLNQTGTGAPGKHYAYTASNGNMYAYSWNDITDATIDTIDFTGNHHVRLEGAATTITPNNGLVEEFGPTGANYFGYDMSDYYAGGDNVVTSSSAGDNSNIPTSGEIALSNFHGASTSIALDHEVTDMEAFQKNDNTYDYIKGYRKNGYLTVYDGTNGFGTGVAEGAMTGTNITINSKTFEIVGTYYSRPSGINGNSASFSIVLDPNGSNTSNPVASDFGSNSYFLVQQDETQQNGPSQWTLRATSSNTSADPSMNIYTETINLGGGAGYPLTFLTWTYQSGTHSNYSNFIQFWEDNNAYYWFSLSSDGRDYSFQYYA